MSYEVFSKKEIDYLKGEIKPNKNYTKTLRKRINKKMRMFIENTLPLLDNNRYTKDLIIELKNQLELRGTENRTIGTEFSAPNNQFNNKSPSFVSVLEERVGIEPTYIRSAGGRVTIPPSLHLI